MPNPSQEPLASSKAQNQDLKDMDVLSSFKNKIESKVRNLGLPKTSDHIKSISGWKTPVRNLQYLLKPKIRT